MTTDYTKPGSWTIALALAGAIGWSSALQAEEPNPEQHPDLTTLASSTLSGFVDTSAIWMFGKGQVVYGRSFDQGSNGGPGLNKQDGFNLDVLSLALEKPLESGEWSAGYRAQLLFGPDANALGATSTLVPGAPGTSDFAFEEAYVSVRAPVGNGLDFKLGVWRALMGYEAVDTPENVNFSRSYGFFIEPNIHTGLLSAYKANEVLTLTAGVVDRGDGINTINARPATESKKSYLAQISIIAPEEAGWFRGATASFAVLDGGVSAATPGRGPAGSASVMDYTATATVPTPLTALSAGLAYDYRANFLFKGSYENAAGLYVLGQATAKLKLADRAEYASGSKGGPASGGFGAYGVPVSATTGEVRLFENTLTADYSIWSNVVSRVELRWDHCLNGQRIFGDGNQRNALSLTLNIIYKL